MTTCQTARKLLTEFEEKSTQTLAKFGVNTVFVHNINKKQTQFKRKNAVY